MFKMQMQVYPSPMNEHTAPGDAGGYLIQFRGKQPLRETARWVTGVALSGVGIAIAVIGTASNSYLSMPLGIAVTVLGALVLVMYSLTKTKPKIPNASLRTHGVKGRSEGSARQSIAADLALLADLYARGALSAEEFAAAKKRILGA